MAKQSWTVRGDRPLSLKVMPLVPFELRVKAHWEEFLPELVRGLNAQKDPQALDKKIRMAVHKVDFQITLHLADHPELHRGQVAELYEHVLWRPPEPARRRATTPSPPAASPPSSSAARSSGRETTSPRSS